MVWNYMESVVDEYLKEELEKYPEKYLDIICDSKKLARIKIITLNQVKPFYVTTKTGEVYGFSTYKIPQQKADIMVEIAKAIDIVCLPNMT